MPDRGYTGNLPLFYDLGFKMMGEEEARIRRQEESREKETRGSKET